MVAHSELALGVHEQHLPAMQPGTHQVDTKGWGVSLLNRTRKDHRIPLMHLDELNVTADLMKTQEKSVTNLGEGEESDYTCLNN